MSAGIWSRQKLIGRPTIRVRIPRARACAAAAYP